MGARLFALAASLLLVSESAGAATYYVRTTGNDGNSGLSPAQAWRTIAHAGNTLLAGDTAYVGAGAYTDKVDVQNSGTATDPIRFIGDSTGAFTGDAGTVVLSDGGDVFKVDDEDYIEIRGLRTTGGKKGFKFKKATGIVLEDCEADGHDDHAVDIDEADVEIARCDFHDNGKEGVRIKKESVVNVRQVRIHDNADEGILVDDDDAVLELSRCEIDGNDARGIHLKKGSVLVVNCVIHGNDSHGIEIDDNDAELTMWHTTVAANAGDGVYQDKGGSTIVNSILVSNGGDGLDRDEGTLTHSYNLVWGNGSQDYEGTSAGTGELSSNPLFVGGGDFHLQLTSPAVDVGTDASAVTLEDRDGLVRPQGVGFDMGAYEAPQPDHFEIVHDGAAVVCVDEAITITRHDGGHARDTGYTGTIVLSTSTAHGDWSLGSGSGTLVNAGGGSATYSFAAADAGQVVLGLVSTYDEVLSVDISDGSTSEGSNEDPDLTFTGGGVTDTYRDDFGSASWANQDGSLPWAGSWLEVDSVAGPGGGNARIAGGELVLEDFSNTNLAIAVQREADLSAHSSAILTFDFRTTSGVDANDGIFVEVSGDGGGSWSTLERIGGFSGAVSSSRTFDISAWIASNTRIRFRVDDLGGSGGSTCCYGAANEEFRVAQVQIATPGSVVCGPDHYAIVHDGSGVNCQAESITIAAHDGAHNVDGGFTGTLSLATSTGRGDWSLVSGGGTLVNGGGGGGSYTFVTGDAGQVVLGLLDSFAETVNVNVSDGSASEAPGEDPDLVFGSAGFSFLADGAGSSIGTQIGGKPSNVAPGDQLLELEAIRTSDATGACEAALVGVNPIEMAFTCEEPATCAGAQVSVSGTLVAANPAGAPSAWTPVSLDFGDDADTTAPFWIAYPDVGRIQLHARYLLAPSGESLAGASNPFVVRPFAFEVTAPGNPGVSTPGGAIFATAGADFTASARAVLWQAADDANADGVADGHDNADPGDNANLADNLPATSYGREVGPEGVVLEAALQEPAGGNDPGLGGTTTIAVFAAGAGSTGAAHYDEVGAIELAGRVPDGDFLGIGAAETARIEGRSGIVGRFAPDHFDAIEDTAPVLTTGCASGGFTYVGQRFDYATAPVALVTARSALGSQTRNYSGAWWKITNASLANRSYAADPGHPASLDLGALPAPAVDPAIVELGDGSGTLTFSLGSAPGSGLRFARAGPTAPFDAEIALSIDVLDGDGVAYGANPYRVGAPSTGNGMVWSAGSAQRYGRLALTNAFGSERVALPVPLRAEYWTGSAFALHGDDSCTGVTAANVGTTARSPAALATGPVVGNLPLVAGDAGLFFTAPGAPGWADVLVNLSAVDVATPWGPIVGADLPWLRWDWSGDGAGPAYDEDPGARITFGIFGGDAPVIFRREIY